LFYFHKVIKYIPISKVIIKIIFLIIFVSLNNNIQNNNQKIIVPALLIAVESDKFINRAEYIQK